MSHENLKVAVAQMQSSADPWENLSLLESYIHEAHSHSCHLIFFPENCLYRGPKRTDIFRREDYFLSLDENQHIEERSEFSRALVTLKEQSPIPFLLGSIMEKKEGEELPFNSSWFCAPGEPVQSYQKIHLFHYLSSQVRYEESRDFQAGTNIVSVDFMGWKIGLSICYDLRFPELYRRLSIEEECNLVLVPAAFDLYTGRAHWETLLRSRAIENQCYLLAPAQWGEQYLNKKQKRSCYGNSMIVSPWGDVLARSGEKGDDLLVYELQREIVGELRERLPALKNCQLIRKAST